MYSHGLQTVRVKALCKKCIAKRASLDAKFKHIHRSLHTLRKELQSCLGRMRNDIVEALEDPRGEKVVGNDSGGVSERSASSASSKEGSKSATADADTETETTEVSACPRRLPLTVCVLDVRTPVFCLPGYSFLAYVY